MREPIAEIGEAARLLDAAVSAHLMDRSDLADELIRLADMPVLRDELRGTTSEQTRLQSISTRCPVGVGDEVAIAGTIIGDPSKTADNTFPKRRVLMFGKGPSLSSLGVPGAMANPKIELHNSTGGVIGSNDQWKDVDGTSTGLEDKLNEPVPGFAPKNVNESALWPTLRQSAYTTILSGVNNGTGIGLVEFYEY